MAIKLNKSFFKGLLKAIVAAAVGYITGNITPII